MRSGSPALPERLAPRPIYNPAVIPRGPGWASDLCHRLGWQESGHWGQKHRPPVQGSHLGFGHRMGKTEPLEQLSPALTSNLVLPLPRDWSMEGSDTSIIRLGLSGAGSLLPYQIRISHRMVSTWL